MDTPYTHIHIHILSLHILPHSSPRIGIISPDILVYGVWSGPDFDPH